MIELKRIRISAIVATVSFALQSMIKPFNLNTGKGNNESD